MTELEQRLTDALTALSGQYEREQKRQAEQAERLEEQVRQLTEQYEQEHKELVRWSNLLADHIDHVRQLADNYRKLTDDLTELSQ